MMEGSCGVCRLATILVCIGAVNWGLVGAFNYDVVAVIFGSMTTAARVAYIVIGVAGLLKAASMAKLCPCCRFGGCCEKKDK